MTRPSHLLLAGACLALLLLGADVAHAHIGLTAPESRYGPDVLKFAPCGQSGGLRSDNVYTFASGQTITIQFEEYVNHPGHYRVAFDDDGDDDFTAPPCLANCDSRMMDIGVAPEDYTDPTVLLDGIADMAGGNYEVTVTLPDIECDNCTLQVIQVMTDKPPYTDPPDNDLYYQCVDLILSRDAPMTDGGVVVVDGGGSGGTDGGSSSGDGGSSSGDGGGTPRGGGGDDGGCTVTATAPASRTPTFLLAAGALLGVVSLRRSAKRR